MLFDQQLRAHLRLLLIGWIGALPDPSADEMRLAHRLIGNPGNRGQFLHAIRGNPAWFDALKARTIPDLLESQDEQVVDIAVHFLTSMLDARVADVTQLLQPHLGRSETWDARIAYCLSRLDNWGSGEAVDMLGDLIRRGQSVERAALSFHDLARTNPDAGCRVLRVYLDRRLNDLTAHRQQATQETRPDSGAPMISSLSDSTVSEHQLFGDHGVTEILDQAVKTCPDSLIENLLPWFVSATALFTSDQAVESYPRDSIFCWGWYGRHLREGALFAVRMTEAIQQLARSDPSTFRSLAAGLASIELYAVQRVLAQGYLADPSTFAYDIFAYLVGDIRRLHLGEVMGSSRYDSCRLFGAAFQHVNTEDRTELERLVLNLRPDWEKHTLKAQGHAQLHFLKSVPREILSPEAGRTRDELERKFPELKLKMPVGVEFETVESPINETARAKMSDNDWLGAMRRYDDSTDWDAIREDRLRGGVVELSRAYAEHVRQDPARFYHLAQRFDLSISANYCQVTISGLADAGAPTEWVFELVRRFAPRLGEHRRGVCWALQKCSAYGVPDDILNMMTEWAVNDPDPEREMWLEFAASGQPYHQGDPYAYGINTNRGVAVITVVQCALDRKPPQTERVFDLLHEASMDPSTAVRSCVIRSLGQMLSHDAQCTLTIFENALSGHLDLLQTRVTHEFLYWTYYDHFLRTRPFINAMLDSEHEETRQTGARLACLASLRYHDAAAMESRVMAGDSVLRRGAAQVYAANLHKEDVRQVCQERLLVLMHDEDDQVLSEVGECFRRIQPGEVEVFRALIEAFLDSSAIMVMCRPLVAYMAQVASEDPDYVLRAAERIWETAGFQVVDIRTSWAILERDLARLPLAVYTHTLDPSLKSRSMDLFERMLLSGSREANRALEDWDRR